MYINVQLLDMDTMIPEQISKNSDDGYTIFLNSRLSQEQRVNVLNTSYIYKNEGQNHNHIYIHIKNDDFEKSDVQEIENFAHKE